MLNRRSILSALVVGAGLAAFGPAQASEKLRFDAAAFAAAKAEGKSILVEVTAPWCPTCQAQKPILSELTAAPKFQNLVIFDVDFDSRKDVLRDLNVQMQSTLITFKGTRETGRSTGDTDPASIAALLDQVL